MICTYYSSHQKIIVNLCYLKNPVIVSKNIKQTDVEKYFIWHLYKWKAFYKMEK